MENYDMEKVDGEFAEQYGFEPWEAGPPRQDGSPPDYYTAIRSDEDGKDNLAVPWDYTPPVLLGKTGRVLGDQFRFRGILVPGFLVQFLLSLPP